MIETTTKSLDFFKFIFEFPSGGTLKGVVKGNLQSDNNTVTNLSDLFAVYYATVIPPTLENPSETLPPLVFDRLNLELTPQPQFTLDGSQLIAFSGTNINGDLFTINNNNSESFIKITIIDPKLIYSEIDIYSRTNQDFPFQSEQVTYLFHINAELVKDQSIIEGIGFPEQAHIKGFILFPNNIAQLKRVNQEFTTKVAIDYPFFDSFFIFSDANHQPKFALIPNGKESKLTAINPSVPSSYNNVSPTNPETSQLTIIWDIGCKDPNSTNEVLTTGASSDLFLPLFENMRSQFSFFDAEQQIEATYEVKIATCNCFSS